MKMSLDGFHKVSKDEKTTVLRHPSGHEMTINHTILSPKMRGEIEALPQAESKHPDKEPKKLAEGGDPESEVQEVEDSYNKFAGTVKPQPKPKTREEKYSEIRKRNTSNASGSTSALDQPVYAEGGEVEPSKIASKAELEKTIERETKPAVFNDELEASIPDEEIAAQKSADAVPSEQIQQASNDVPGVNSDVQAQPFDHDKAAAESHANMTAAHNAAMQAYAASKQPQAQAQPSVPSQQPQPAQPEIPTQQSEQPQPVANGTLGQAEAGAQEMQNYIKDQDTKNTDLFNKVMQNKIDPNRLWNNKDTGTKIVNTIGLILGGLGASSATGGKNLAVEAMNHAIERDVDAQKANQSNQMNLYKMNLEATHNAEEARNMTVNQLLAASGAELAKKSATINNDLTKQKILEAGQDIQQKMIQNSQNSYLFKQLQGEGGEQANSEAGFQNKMNTLRLLKPDYAKDLEAKYLPGVGVASVPIPETARTEMMDRVNLSKKLAALENFSKEHGGVSLDKLDPAIRNQGSALAADVQNAYRSANKQGVFKESENKFVNKIIHDDPTSLFSNWNAIPGYRQTRDSNNVSIDSMKKGYGVKSFGQPQQAQQSIPDGTKATTKSGQPVIRQNGQWIKQ